WKQQTVKERGAHYRRIVPTTLAQLKDRIAPPTSRRTAAQFSSRQSRQVAVSLRTVPIGGAHYRRIVPTTLAQLKDRIAPPTSRRTAAQFSSRQSRQVAVSLRTV